MVGKDDEEQLRYAASSERAILTFDQKHFRPLYDDWWSAERTHSGIDRIVRGWADQADRTAALVMFP